MRIVRFVLGIAVASSAIPSMAQLQLKALNPSLTGSVSPAEFVTLQTVDYNGVIHHLKPGTQVRITAVAPGTTPCNFSVLNGAVLPSGPVAPDGTFPFTLKGWFAPLSEDGGSCGMDIRYSAVGVGGDAINSSFKPEAHASATQVYPVMDTAQLAKRLSFGLLSSHGTCEGTSQPGDQPVGLRTVGGDLQFNIRSGPAGTECVWKSKASLLPNGVHLTGIQIISTSGGPCSDRSSLTTNNIGQWGTVSMLNPATGVGGVIAGANPNPGAPIGTLGGTTVSLDCGMTITNDKSVNVKIDTMTFRGPAHLTFP